MSSKHRIPTQPTGPSRDDLVRILVILLKRAGGTATFTQREVAMDTDDDIISQWDQIGGSLTLSVRGFKPPEDSVTQVMKEIHEEEHKDEEGG